MAADPLFRADGGFFLIAGPCVLEDDALNLAVGESLARLASDLAVPVVYKASFDKANRSLAGSPRGPGLHEGLERLARVRQETGLPVLTDVHEAAQAAAVAEVCDVLQIPAFLCRQTDLVEAAAATGRPVNIKKGQWMSPEEMRGPIEKARGAGGRSLAVTERGTFFGYGNLVVDMRSFARMRRATGCPVVYDGTHSVQRPGEAATGTGGDPEHIPALVRAAIAAGADGLFLETHPRPEQAPSDGANMLKLDGLRALIEEVLALREVLGRQGAHV